MTGENEKNSMCQEMWRTAQDLSRIANGIEKTCRELIKENVLLNYVLYQIKLW